MNLIQGYRKIKLTIVFENPTFWEKNNHITIEGGEEFSIDISSNLLGICKYKVNSSDQENKNTSSLIDTCTYYPLCNIHYFKLIYL